MGERKERGRRVMIWGKGGRRGTGVQREWEELGWREREGKEMRMEREGRRVGGMGIGRSEKVEKRRGE